jgi:hypothetical protein
MRALPRVLLLALAPLLALGCAGTPASWRVVQPLERPVTARLVAVYPFTFRWEEPPSRGLLLGMMAADAFSATDRLLVLGPSEFTVLRREADDPRAGTDLVAAMALRSLPANAFVAIRCWAEKREERTSGASDLLGKPVATTVRVTYLEHVELLDGGGGGVLFELHGEVDRDPTAAGADPFDPTPELTRLHARLLRAAWEILEPKLTTAKLRPLPARVRWLPAAALTWAPPGVPPLAARLAKADPLEADLQRLAIYRFVDPSSDDQAVAREERLPGGLRVEAVEGPWTGLLRPGDVVTVAGGEPATGRQVLQRVVALADGEPVRLGVVRDGATVTVSVPTR